MRFIFVLFISILFTQSAIAQDDLSSDDLFKLAREKAFDDDDYPTARQICKQALQKSPNYTDISVFLARLYLYDDKYDSARLVLEEVYQRKPKSLDVLGSLFDLEFWSDNPKTALEYANAGLEVEQNNEEFLLKKAKALADLDQYKAAKGTIDTLLKINQRNTDARIFAERLRRKAAKDNIALSYDYDKFDVSFDPWHFASLSYGHAFKKVSVTGRINYANRFLSNATQYELDAYPDVSKKMYAYVSVGFSNDGIFPKYRLGASLYRNLPQSFEADLGFRYLQFSNPTIIYTAALGKYYKSYWFSLRTFITPDATGISQSVSLITRRYFSSATHFLSLAIGRGAVPDASTQILFLLNKTSTLQSTNIRLTYQQPFQKTFVIGLRASYENQEYRTDLYRKDYSVGIMIEKYF